MLRNLQLPVRRDAGATALKIDGRADRSAKPGNGSCRIVLTLGMSPRQQLPPSVTEDSARMPNFSRAVFEWFRRERPDARCTSVVFAFNMLARMHGDLLNAGPSELTAVGAFSGGALWQCEPDSNIGHIMELSAGQWHTFDSLWPHCGLAFSGERCYISFYCHRTFGRDSPATRKALRDMRVPLPLSADFVR